MFVVIERKKTTCYLKYVRNYFNRSDEEKMELNKENMIVLPKRLPPGFRKLTGIWRVLDEKRKKRKKGQADGGNASPTGSKKPAPPRFFFFSMPYANGIIERE